MSKLVKQKPSPKGKQKKKPASPEEVFTKLYAKIQRFQQQNDKLKEHITSVFRQFEETVAEDEKALMRAQFDQTENLIRFFPKKSLAKWHKEVLFEWIVENLEDISANPFNNDIDTMPLKMALHDALEANFGKSMGAAPPDIENPTSENASHSEEHGAQEQDDLFGFADDEDWYDEDDEDDFDDIFESEFREHFEQFEQTLGEEQKAQKSKLDKLFKSSTVSKMFRQLSKKLHPDLEQDETAKEEKHKQMAKLLDARRNHDVLEIFAMHTAVFGTNADQFSRDDIEQLIPLLKNQLTQVQNAKDDILDDDPLHGRIYEWFGAKTPQATANKIKRYQKELQERTQRIKSNSESITSIVKLKPHLEVRYDQHMLNDLGDIPF